MAGPPVEAPSCVDYALAETIDPAGTAGSYRQIAVVEIPLPWPRDIGMHPSVEPVAGAVETAGMRVQAVVPGPDSDPARRRVIHYRRPEGPFRAYDVYETRVPEGDLAGALSDLASDRGAGREPAEAPGVGRTIDVLVCGHGSRDRCCGRLGTRLVDRLGGARGAATGAAGNGDGSGVRARVWRTSHTGGHRFAPTALILPEGTGWAFLDGDLLDGVVHRTLDIDVAAGLYRGCTGLDHPAIQACDREALRTVGWSWLDHHRAGRILTGNGADANGGAGHDGTVRVRLEHTAPDGSQGAFEGTVEVSRRLPVPECRRPLVEWRKDAPELAVRDFASV